jgi:transposase
MAGESCGGILWILRTGAPWGDLPDRYPSYQGELLIRDRRWEEAETALRHALRIAREQQAQGFELRVAASLDRLQAAKSSQPSER